ncbi:MAG: taurine dioxygenase [Rhodospirillaceae bacterium]|nr:taurine dioxygenase [Rhodospirillaceae bacterium]
MAYETIEVEPLAGSIGAEIAGVDLSKPLSNRQSDEVYRAFLEYSVVFFRDQDLSPEQEIAAGRVFGEPYSIPFVKPMDGYPELIDIIKEPEDVKMYNFGGRWHHDVSFQEEPAKGALLYALEAPKWGGDTVFASMYAAYETLSDGMKALLEPLVGLHSGRNSYGASGKFVGGANSSRSMQIENTAEGDAVMEHPVVRTHPETGRKCLFVNQNYTVGIKGMEEREARPILDFLLEHATRDEFTCRFRWRSGSVAVWDNRAAMHHAINDYDGARRHMRRVTLKGDRPFREQPSAGAE